MKKDGYSQEQIDDIDFTDYFCCICFIYFSGKKIYVKQISTILASNADMFSLFQNGYNECCFSQFDYEPYDKSAPDEESVKDDGMDASELKNFISITPWWINSGSVSYSSSFEFDKSLDFRYIASKENTYAFVCARDMNNTDCDGSLLCKELTDIFGKYAYTVESLCDRQTYSGMFCEKLRKGTTYKKFLFFEFSHGGTGEITCEPGEYVKKDDVWNALKDAKNVIFGIFESCHSQSMFKLSRTNSMSPGNDESLASFIVRKFNERKSLRSKKPRLFGSSFTEPMILLWSSAPSHDYSYYLPPSYVDGVHYYGGMSKAIE